MSEQESSSIAAPETFVAQVPPTGLHRSPTQQQLVGTCCWMWTRLSATLQAAQIWTPAASQHLLGWKCMAMISPLA